MHQILIGNTLGLFFPQEKKKEKSKKSKEHNFPPTTAFRIIESQNG